MTRELNHIDVSKLPELLQLAREVQRTQRPSVLRGDSQDLAIVVPVARSGRARPLAEQALEAQIWSDVGTDPSDLWANYDPERVKQALRRSTGALAGVDREQLLQDIEEAREQDTPGRPA